MKRTIRNIFQLGIKELIGLGRDYLLLALILFSFSFSVIIEATGKVDTISDASIAIVDEDQSPCSLQIADAFCRPLFAPAKRISRAEIDSVLDSGKYTFVLVIHNGFEQELFRENAPKIQLNVDATRMEQAFVGTGYIQQIIANELEEYLKFRRTDYELVEPVIRNRFNPNLSSAWYESAMALINNITMLAIILTGAALIRERENGTLEHLLVMPVTPFQIMVSKIWSMMLVVLIASTASLLLVVNGILNIPIAGSVPLFVFGVALYLFAATSIGIFLSCIAQNMPQLGMLLILILIPMQLLSGGTTPAESMPRWVQIVMQAAPTTHFVSFSQAILFRGAGWNVVYLPFLKLFIIGALLFFFSLRRFHRSVA